MSGMEASGPSAGLLVAGVGNLLLGDDGFGCAVARELSRQSLPRDVSVRDFGIRGVHLAYELLDGGVRALLVADTLSRGSEPGTLYVFEPDLDDLDALEDGALSEGAHGMDLPRVFTSVRSMGGELPRVLLVGCEPASLEEGIGLSAPVERAVMPAVGLIRELIERELASPCATP